MRPRYVIALVLTLSSAACDGASPAKTDRSASLGMVPHAESRVQQQARRAPAAAPAPHVQAIDVAGGTGYALGPRRPRFATPGAPAMVIRNGHASIEVDSLEPAITAVRALAARVGGHIANTSMQTGDDQLRAATLEVKIPAARFDDALTGLDPIGEVESVNITAEDVGEEYVDVEARIANARRLEQRLIGILAQRTGRLKDVLDVEQALARVREEIERHEGRLRYLRAHTAMSTLAIYVHEPVPVVGRAGTSVMGEAFAQAWRNFVTLVALFVQSLGVLVPLGALATLGWLGVQRWRKSHPAAVAAD